MDVEPGGGENSMVQKRAISLDSSTPDLGTFTNEFRASIEFTIL